MADDLLEAYKAAVRASLETILGESAAKAVLFYVGEVEPATFEGKIRSILGEGAALVLDEVKRETQGEPQRHHWLGRGRSHCSGQRWGRGDGLSPGPSFFAIR